MKRISFIALLLLTCTLGTWAQAYEFNIEDGTVNGIKYTRCRMKEDAILGTYSPKISIVLVDLHESNRIPHMEFWISKHANTSDKNELTIVNNIRKLANSIPTTSKDRRKNVTINLHLSNGEILSGTNRGAIQGSLEEEALMFGFPTYGILNPAINTSNLVSSRTPKQIGTIENQKVICQKLRTHDIVKIEIDGINFNTQGLHSAATFDAMFDALAKKTGKGDRYKTNGSNSSSQTKASATGNLSFVGIISDGDLWFIFNDVNINGAKGKEVNILVSLEDVNTGELVQWTVTKQIFPTSERSYFEVINLVRNVQDKYSWDFPKNGGTFNVRAVAYYMDSKSTGFPIGEIGSKRITILRRPDGSWHSF